MKTYWKHRITLAYIAATDQRWKETMTARLADMAANFMKYSKGGTIIDEHHWMSRPRACVYYRQINYINDDAGQAHGFTKPPIVNFDWKTAQPLATSDPPKLTATKRHTHPNGEDMTNEQTIQKTMLRAHEERLQYVGTERTFLHSDLT